MFDSHAHYHDEAFNEDRNEVLEAVKDSGVKYIVNLGTDIRTSKESIVLSGRYDFIYAGVGVHPHDASKAPESYIDEIKKLSQHNKVVAIGEIGLDYHYDFSPRELQKKIFREQINLARELHLPVVIHNRDSHEDMLSILKEEKISEVGGVLHCFSGSAEMARELVKMGIYIGIGGPVTFSNAKKTVEVVKEIPLEYLLSETDCPYLTPVPNRGKRNDSSYMRDTIEKIAEIKGIQFEDTNNVLISNAKKFFKIN